MKRDEYLKDMEARLHEMGRSLDAMKGEAGEEPEEHGLFDELKARSDAVMKRLDELRQSGTDRWDVLKMGVESAWDELRTAFETATSKDLQKTDKTGRAA